MDRVVSSEIDNGTESEPVPVLVDQTDFGYVRLRPRPVAKTNHGPMNKVQCDICHKYYRAEYIKVSTSIISDRENGS